MKKIDSKFFRALMSLRGRSYHYTPFPGKHPVRLYVAVGVRDAGKIYLRYRYQGKWKQSVFVRARKIYAQLEHDRRVALVAEFCKTGLVSYGSLNGVSPTPLRKAVFQTRLGAIKNPRSILPDVVDFVPFKLEGKVWIMLDRAWLASESEEVIRNLCKIRYRAAMRGTDEDYDG